MKTRNYKKAYKKADAGVSGESAQDRALNLFAEMMISKIESIAEDWRKPWFTEGLHTWPKNMDGRHYNGMNSLMLLMHCEKQGYQFPVFCTFDRVLGMNYTRTSIGNVPAVDADGNKRPTVHVNKGEKSFPVFLTTFTVVHNDTKEKIKYEEYKKLSADEQSKYTVFPKMQVFNVFNIAQTNLQEARPEIWERIVNENTVKKPEQASEISGKPNAEPKDLSSAEAEEIRVKQMFRFEPMDRMIDENLWFCPIKQQYGDRAYFSPSKNEIVLPEFRQFTDGESFYSTALHEMAHSTSAENLLNRPKHTTFGDEIYSREELIAELTSALVAQYYGFDTHIKEDSAAYLKSWLQNLKEDAKFIRTVLLDVKKAASIITKRIDDLSATAADAA